MTFFFFKENLDLHRCSIQQQPKQLGHTLEGQLRPLCLLEEVSRRVELLDLRKSETMEVMNNGLE